MKQVVKRFLYAIAPQWTTSLMSARSRAHSHRVVEAWGCGQINQKLIQHLGSNVQEGPFAGMTLTPLTYSEQVGPYLLGVYESELDEAWATVFRGSYPQIIDVGAKFGYYAVGLAKKYPAAKVVAFDTDWWARKAVQEMATANEVKNVEVKGFCTSEWLSANTQEGAFIISDCEGYESVLFNPRTLPKLLTATLIIEVHDCFVPGVSEKLRALFQDSHVVGIYGLEGSRRTTTRSLDFLTEAELPLATQEVRSPQTWLLCLPKTGRNNNLHETAKA